MFTLGRMPVTETIAEPTDGADGATPETIDIVLADKTQIVLGGLKLLFGEDARFRVVATASDGERFMEAVERIPFDVGIIGWVMPYLDGRGVLSALRERETRIPVIVYTGAANRDLPRQAMALGAAGFFSKSEPPERLLDVVAAVAAGQMVFPQLDVRGLHDDPLNELTVREHELLGCLVQGRTNRQIAAQLGISVNTVKFHLKNLYGKMDTENRAQTVARYLTLQQSDDDG